MSIKKISLIAVGAAILTISASVLAEIEVKPYGAAQYRLRGRIFSVAGNDSVTTVPGQLNDSTANTFDYLNLVGWHAGVNVKVDEKLSLQLQIGNDWGANEVANWTNNNTSGGTALSAPAGGGAISSSTRVGFNNLYVHLANATWNPGYIYLSAGVVGLATGGPLDLLERSLATGRYNDAIYQTWVSHANNSIIGLKLGVPIVKEGVKVSAELTSSVIDTRSQSTAAADANVAGSPKSNPTSLFFALNIPVAAGDFKVTPEFVSVVNRNYNSATEEGDHEFIGGLLASYKVSQALSLNVSGAYGQVGNENSKVGGYGNVTRSNAIAKDAADSIDAYESAGWLVGVGGSLKAGPGTIALDVKYNNAVNGATDDTKKATNTNNIYIDPRYTINVHPKFTITPRWRVYIDTFGENNPLKSRIENRPEIIITGSL